MALRLLSVHASLGHDRAVGTRPPSNASIDALFEGARSAKIVAGPGFPGGVLLELAGEDLPELRETLRIVESDERFHCMCLGDLAIELRGRWLSAGRVSFHHGVSVRVDGWSSDARLCDGPALLRFLARRGVADPLRAYEQGRDDDRARASGRQAWVAAAPAEIRASLAELESDAFGMPRLLEAAEVDAALARIRGDRSDRDVARALLAWLAVGRGPWSGYASYESVPIRLLEALPIESVVEVATDPALGDAMIVAAARFFGNHELVSFHKSALAAVPDSFFERARPLLGVEDDRQRHDAAARIARDVRRPRGAPYPIGCGVEVVGESTDGPLTGLAAIGDVLVSADVRTIVRFEPGSVAAVPVADARDTFVYVSSTAPLAWATGRTGVIATEHGTIAAGENGPVEIASSERGVAWIAKEGQDGRALRAVVRGDPTVRTLATDSLLWHLAVDRERAFFIEAGWRGGGTLCSVPLAGGKIERVTKVPELGPSMGSPRYVIEGREILLAVGDHVLAIDAEGRTRRLVDASKPIRAIAADATHVALVIGEDGGRDSPWTLAVAPRSGGHARGLASFSRAPYHRHPLSIARGRACTVVGDQIIAVPLAL